LSSPALAFPLAPNCGLGVVFHCVDHASYSDFDELRDQMMEQTMRLQCNVSALTSESANVEVGTSVNLHIMPRRTLLWLAGVAALALAGLALFGQSAPTFVSNDSARPSTPQFLSEAANRHQLDGDLAEFQFGYVEFDWPPGKVPGFGPMPPTHQFASAPAQP